MEDNEDARQSYLSVKHITLTILAIISIGMIVYFIVIGLGIGWIVVIDKNYINITTGECFNTTHCQNSTCYYNPKDLNGLFRGCIFSGILYLFFIALLLLGLAHVIAFLIIILWGIGYVCCWIYNACVYYRLKNNERKLLEVI
jgi:hypothetical protein